jgi:uncharacterized protein YehS (DUF1456 family)
VLNNDILRSVRYMLDCSDTKLWQITLLSFAPDVQMPDAPALEKAAFLAFLKKDDEPGFQECSDVVLLHFLNGLVLHFRGPAPGPKALDIYGLNVTPRRDSRINNNLILKKLRVAFELKDVDLLRAFDDAGFPVAKAELSALFRDYTHRNYRPCGDQMLRNCLKGLTIRARGLAQGAAPTTAH